MNALLQDEETPLRIEEHAFDGSLAYLRRLTTTHPGTIEFRTGAGHIFFDLLAHLPSIAGYEEEKMELTHLIEEHAYPLAASLYAQAVDIVITISPNPLGPPKHVNALASFTAFDAGKGILRHGFLSPHHAPPDADDLTISLGLTVECEPLNYHYHQLKDDRGLEPSNAAGNLPMRDYAGRNKDPQGGYSEDVRAAVATPILDTKIVPRWLLEGRAVQEIIPRVSGTNGATHIPAYIRLLNVSPHHHIYDAASSAWKWEPAAKLQPRANVIDDPKPEPSPQPVAKPMVNEEAPEPKRSVYLSVPAPGLVPGWYRSPA